MFYSPCAVRIGWATSRGTLGILLFPTQSARAFLLLYFEKDKSQRKAPFFSLFSSVKILFGDDLIRRNTQEKNPVFVEYGPAKNLDEGRGGLSLSFFRVSSTHLIRSDSGISISLSLSLILVPSIYLFYFRFDLFSRPENE